MPARKKRNNFLKKMDNVLTKSSALDGSSFKLGFSKLNMGISLTNFALNRIMTGSWDMGFRFGRSYAVYGESGSGKSLLAALACAQAQKDHEAMAVWIDTEHATDDESGMKWFDEAGVDRSDEKFIYTNAKSLSDVKKIISNTCVNYRVDYEKDPESMYPLILVVDSWNMGLTDAKMKQMKEGKLVGDMGQQAKQIGDVISASTHLVEGLPVMLVGILHVYDSQELYGRKHKTTGGNKVVFTASGALLLTKRELREEDLKDGGQHKHVTAHYDEMRKGMDADTKALMESKKNILGIQCIVENLKSRAAKPFEKIPMNIIYPIGIDPYSGLWEQLMFEGVMAKSGKGWYSYKEDGLEVKFQRPQFRKHAKRLMKVAETHDQYAKLRELMKNPEQIEEAEDATEEIPEPTS